MSQRNILVTTALPYVTGEIHLGYIIEATQADIWVRFQRLCNHQCIFISGNDAHGTGAMLAAQKQGISTEQLVNTMHAEHLKDVKAFYIEFDNFYTTHSPENSELLQIIYHRLHQNGDIHTRSITQAYDKVENLFLADRFIRGTCPRCGAADQYGDNCEVCGSTYDPMDLINPISVVSGSTPITKDSLHYFFRLEKYAAFLKEWGKEEHHLQPQVANKLNEWFEQGLKDWDISRDSPYFGFEIPNAPGKYFYVWMDAPIGYMASFKNLCQKRSDLKFENYWNPESTAELYHFIGKDIIYFHSLFWPAILHSANFRLPTAIRVHGFLTINGEKMSKSRGTFITAKKYLQHELNPEYLRYYFATKLNAQIEDIDLQIEDFVTRVNADLVGKYINLASRCAGFITKKFHNQLGSSLPDFALFEEFVDAGNSIAENYEHLDYSRAVREIMALADRANQYIDHHKPWALAKDSNRDLEVQAICTQGLNLFKLLTLYLKPILPVTAKAVEEFLNISEMTWEDRKVPLLNHEIKTFTPLMQRVAIETAKQLLS